MYTSLSPCDMCTGAMILYKVKRCVIAENKTFVGGEGKFFGSFLPLLDSLESPQSDSRSDSLGGDTL